MSKIFNLVMATLLAGFAMMQPLSAEENFGQSEKSFTIAVLPDTQFYADTRHKLSAKWGNGDLQRISNADGEAVGNHEDRQEGANL